MACPSFSSRLPRSSYKLDVAGRELPPGEELLDGPLLIVLAIVAGQQGLIRFRIVGLHLGGDEELPDRLAELPFLAIDLADRLAEDRDSPRESRPLACRAGRRRHPGRARAEDGPQGLQGVAAVVDVPAPGDHGGRGRIDGLGRLLQAGEGPGLVAVIAREHAVADPAARGRALMEGNRFLKVIDRRVDRFRSPGSFGPAWPWRSRSSDCS